MKMMKCSHVYGGRTYEMVAAIAAHPGGAVIISVTFEGTETGIAKLSYSMANPTALVKWGNFDENEFVAKAIEQYIERELIGCTLEAWPNRYDAELI